MPLIYNYASLLQLHLPPTIVSFLQPCLTFATNPRSYNYTSFFNSHNTNIYALLTLFTTVPFADYFQCLIFTTMSCSYNNALYVQPCLYLCSHHQCLTATTQTPTRWRYYLQPCLSLRRFPSSLCMPLTFATIFTTKYLILLSKMSFRFIRCHYNHASHLQPCLHLCSHHQFLTATTQTPTNCQQYLQPCLFLQAFQILHIFGSVL